MAWVELLACVNLTTWMPEAGVSVLDFTQLLVLDFTQLECELLACVNLTAWIPEAGS